MSKVVVEEIAGYLVVLDLPIGRYYKGSHSKALKKNMLDTKPYRSIESVKTAQLRLKRVYVDGKNLPHPHGVFIVSVRVIAKDIPL